MFGFRSPLFPEKRFETNASLKKKAFAVPRLFLLFIFVLVLIGGVIYTSFEIGKEFNTTIFERRQALAFLTASVVNEKLDRIVDVGVSLATRPVFVTFVEAHKWDEVIALLAKTPHDFPFIQNIVFYTPQGILQAALPADPEVSTIVGHDFSYRDYYKGVVRNWQPYIGEAIKPAVPLGYNLIPVAIPISSDTGAKLGIMVFLIKLDTITMWNRDIDVGPDGFVYLVDQKGDLVAHPTLLPSDDVIDFSTVPVVQKVLRGERGVEIFQDTSSTASNIISYEPIPKYGWGVIVQQPVSIAFAGKGKVFFIVGSIWALLFLGVFFLYLSLRNKKIIEFQKDREKIFLESIGDGVVAIDQEGKVLFMNRAGRAMLGLEDDIVESVLFHDLVCLQDEKGAVIAYEKRPIYAALTGTITSSRTLTDFPYYYVRKDKTRFPVAMTIVPVVSEGEIVAAIEVFRDINKEKEIDRAKSEFVSLASHQLRTPLSIINWYTELLLTDFLGPMNQKQKKYLEEVYKGSQRMVVLVNSLLNVSRLELGTFLIDPRPADVCALVKNQIDEQKILVEKKDITFSYYFAKNIPPVNVDVGLFSMVIENILSNAVKYTPERGTISVSVSVTHDAVQQLLITISDTGYGIPKKQQEKIFTKLFRADNILKKDTEGTGLGLYIVKLIIETSGGTVSFVSEEDKGTTFSITLPLTGMKKKEGTRTLE